MRAALWLVFLFAVAVALALFVGRNQGVVTLFLPSHRVDVSLNLALLGLLTLFVLLYATLRVVARLRALPAQARRWRAQQHERAIHHELLQAQTHALAGRYSRADRAAHAALARVQALQNTPEAALPDLAALRVLALLAAAESAQSLHQTERRDALLRQALTASQLPQAPAALHEATLLRAARWALRDGDGPAALHWLQQLPPGAQRRTLALRLRQRAASLSGQAQEADRLARLLARRSPPAPAPAAATVLRLPGPDSRPADLPQFD